MALLLAVFAGGMYAGHYKVFPHAVLSTAYKTFVAAVQVNFRPSLPSLLWNFLGRPSPPSAAQRFEFIGKDHLTDPILVPARQGHFREYCPGHAGCLAVEYAGRGEVRHVWPYRPDELEKWMEKEEFAADFPYEHALGFSFLN